MDGGEHNRFIKVWLMAMASSSYCYALSTRAVTLRGFPRLLLVLPVIYLFTILPFSLSSCHLGGITFFYLVWLGNFKLLLFSFDLGPLSPSPPNKPLSLAQFVCICLLPIKVKHSKNGTDPSHHPIRKPDPKVDPAKCTESGTDLCSQGNQTSTSKARNFGAKAGRSVLFAVKILVLAVIIKLYERTQDLPRAVLLAMYCCHVYLGAEIALAASATLAWATLGLELDPQFNEPYLATSLQDFWGRRWNLMVPDILRPTIYDPVRRVSNPLVGKKWALVAGVVAAFTVSGLMHEWIYYYFTRVSPTWEVTWFFVLHGVCTSIEVVVKKATTWRLHPAMSRPLTVGFVAVTGVWLFFPQLLRNDVHLMVINEYPVMIDFIKGNVLASHTWH